ncbi:L-aspartate oxidase [Xylanimonas cellulosilytica DSM 15894]|uniref:L-aspartate oxidase n=1 Tax=Xylanimonas cellulosilytica (strain DSM 15894 / JCM 12276 / CECT 5975 / KCTC 9989 / LMG 20990 / NBRC 107835 / XIL07) TaxID=446471 RepID=D1BVB7_XYLCX|nr:L-aspartate oxidase [Xylanimonas cellulosilytica]ACZ29388.1 L-aspartate oxidase [Xylanimonas cellulosilytica DSM 15894]
MRVVVVGSGAAGLLAAYRAASRGHDVALVTKADLPESNTRYAQGGVAAVMFEDDTVDAHVADTLVAGAGLCDAEAVRLLCTEGPDRVRDLLALGLELDRVAGPGSPLARGREAAHSADRILHSHGDSTGLSLEIALIEAVRSVPIEVHEHAFLRDLLVEEGTDASRRVVGVDVVHADGSSSQLRADAVVLATGGAGQLYAHTTNPLVTTGDGVAAALRAGAVVADLEFYQFHPTALAVPGTPLISEAVRGEGAVLRDAAGRRFMLDVHPDAELAPRDVVARGIAAAMAAQGGDPVVLDATAQGSSTGGTERMTRRFPGITTTLAAHGYSWDDPIPVTPAAHYWMGGIRTDLWGRTSLPGLFAVGEAACTGVHGANRLASNSLLEALVFGWRAAEALESPHTPDVSARGWGAGRRAPDNAHDSLAPRNLSVARQGMGLPASDNSWGAGSRGLDRAALQALLWDRAGLVRDGAGLRDAHAVLSGLVVGSGSGRQTEPTTRPRTDDQTAAAASVRALEDRNLVLLGRAVVAAALARTESRGGHARSDFPAADPAQAVSTTWRLPEHALVPAAVPTGVSA